MDAEEARRVLGLSSDDDWPAHESSFQAARDQIADLVRRSPTEAMAQRYQDGLMEFDRALAFYREKKNVLMPPPVALVEEIPAAVESAPRSSPARAFAIVFLFLAVLAGGGFFGWKEWQRREEAKLQWQIAQWEAEAADHISKRRWQEAIVLYQKIEDLEPKSEISLKGRRSIEAGMLEEQGQYLAYWAGEAVAAFEGSRWEEALEAIAKVREVQPRHEEMSALAEKVRFMQTAGIRQQWKDQAQQAIDRRDWSKALVWVEKILAAEPQYELAKQWQMTAIEGRKTDEANRLRAQDLYQQALQGDQGRYDPRVMEMIREAKKLAPSDERVTALYDKIASYSRTIRVPQDFPQLQAAFDAAQPQDRIVIGAGEYPGPFSLDVPVVLEAAADGVVLVCPAESAPALTLGKKADGAQIKGVEFRHSTLHAEAERYSTVLVVGAKVTFEACRFIRAAGHGLALIQGADALVEQCRFEDNGWNGISIQDQGTRATVRQSQMLANIHHGIEVWNQAAAVLENNRCADNCLNGMLIDSPAVVSVKGNQLTGNRDYGIVLRQAGGGQVEDNRLADNLLGGMVVAKGASSMTCTRNVFGKNGGAALSLGEGLEEAGYLNNTFGGGAEKSIRRDLPVE